MKERQMVSVVIPVYNGEKFINSVMDDITRQTYTNYEVIFVDDGSKDSTRQNIEMHQGDPRIKYFYKSNGGPAAARDYGIARAVGDYVAFLDADDKWMPEKLKKQVDLSEKYPSMGLTFTNSYYSDFETKRIDGTSLPPGLRKEDITKRVMVNGCFMLTSSVKVKRPVFNTVGCFDEDLWFAEDWDLFFRITNNFSADFIAEPLSDHRAIRGSLSGTRAKKDIDRRIEQERIVVERIYQYAAKYGLTSKNKNTILQNLLINSVRTCLFYEENSLAREYLRKALVYNYLSPEIFRLFVYSFFNSR